MKYLAFIVLAIMLASCSHKSEEQLLTEGHQAESSKDFSLAVNLYSDLVSTYPHGQHAEEAQYRIAVLYGNEIHDSVKAANAYHTFYQNFPASEHAPSAMFLCAFIYNNVLHNIDSARAIYTAFLQKYPTNDLAASAQFELRTLGQDPESVLHQDFFARQPEGPDSVSSAAKQPSSARAVTR